MKCSECPNMQPELIKCGRNIFYCYHPEAKTECLPHRIITRSRETDIPIKSVPSWCPLKPTNKKAANPTAIEKAARKKTQTK